MAYRMTTCPECDEMYRVEGRNNRDAECRVKRIESDGRLCRDCENAADTARAIEQAAAEGLPPLVGTEKQIGWAETLRIATLKWLEEEERPRSARRKRADEELPIIDALIAIVRRQTSARWFIDARGQTISDLHREFRDLLDAPGDVPADEAPEVLQPEAPASDMVVTITVGGRDVVARSDAPDDRLRGVLRDAGLRWDDTRWARRVPKSLVEVYGSPSERAAELARDVLAAGFSVLVPDPIVRDMAVSGEFSPEAGRFCSAIPGSDDVLICTERDDALNDDLRDTIPGVRWNRERRGWRASAWRAAEVRDYCTRHELLIAEAAEARLAACERALTAGVTVKVPPKDGREPAREDILEIPEGIDPSLLDV